MFSRLKLQTENRANVTRTTPVPKKLFGESKTEMTSGLCESNTPAVLGPIIVDTSGSVDHLAEGIRGGLNEYYRILKGDDLSAVSVLSMLTLVSSEVVATPYGPVAEFQVPELVFGGGTSMGQGIVTTINATFAELQRLAAAGRSLNRVGLTIITDGYASDDYTLAMSKLRELEKLRSANIFPIAVGDAAYEFLEKLSTKTKPARLKSDHGSFTALLQWLATVHSTYSRSRPGDIIETPPTDAWRESR